jgi:CBS domain containing-hemolysin-like protein
MEIVARPVVWFMGSTSTVLWAMQMGNEAGQTVSLDDIGISSTPAQLRIVEPFEQKLALGALLAGRKLRCDIMPADRFDAMDVDTPADEILGTVAMAGFRGYRVQADLDHVIGFVHIRTCFANNTWAGPSSCACCIRLFRSREYGLDRLLELFRKSTTSGDRVTNTAAPKAWSRSKMSSRNRRRNATFHRRHEEQKIFNATTVHGYWMERSDRL